MANSLDFSKMCRACLSVSEPLKDLFSVCSPDVFKFCTSVEILPTDPLPKGACQKCIDLLDQFYIFKKVVIKSNNVLREHCPAELRHKIEGTDEAGSINQIEEINLLEQTETTNDDLFGQINLPTDDEDRSVKTRKRRNYSRGTGKDKPQGKRPRMKCVKCEKSFQKYENLEAHMRSHFGKKPDIKCDQCGKTFLNFRTLNAHTRTHVGARNYQCQTCGKHFAYLNVLKNHEMIHSGIKKHACHICDMKFVQAYNLKMHLETHSAQKNYGCVQCGKKFAQPGNLKIHLIRHTGIKNIACSICDMKFYVKSDLYKHLRSHSESKPYACNLCDKTFKSKSFHTVHMRTHTGERPFACDLCPKRFMARKDLRNHRMIHTGEKPHKCQICNQAFIQKCALNRHMKGHNSISSSLVGVPSHKPAVSLQRHNASMLHLPSEGGLLSYGPLSWQPDA